jgi:hypothetical protein
LGAVRAADITPSRGLRLQPARRWTHCGVLLPIKVSALAREGIETGPAGH